MKLFKELQEYLIKDKQSYLQQSMLSRHCVTITPSEIFKDEPNLGLRDIALKIISELKKNHQVIVDDDFRSKTTRKSLLFTIQKKIPSCKVLIAKLLPKYGFLQVMWSHQFALLSKKTIEVLDGNHVKKWFTNSLQEIDFMSGYVDLPKEEEGCQVVDIPVPLTINSQFKLKLPALLIQWDALLMDSEEDDCKVIRICSCWKEVNPYGRIIFICDGKKVTTGISSAQEDFDNIAICLNKLAKKVDHPVYAVQVVAATNVGNFIHPPQPGLLALLQLRHLLNLHTKQTVYLFHSPDHMRMAEAAGIRNMKIASALKSPDTIIKGHGATPLVPTMLQTIEVKITDVQNNKNPELPLYECFQQHPSHDHVSDTLCPGVKEHLFVNSSFSRYQEEFVAHVMSKDQHRSITGEHTVTQPSGPDSIRNKKRISQNQVDESAYDIPNWMLKKPRREPTITSTDSGIRKTGSPRYSRTLYFMTEKELKDMAKQVLSEAGAE